MLSFAANFKKSHLHSAALDPNHDDEFVVFEFERRDSCDNPEQKFDEAVVAVYRKTRKKIRADGI